MSNETISLKLKIWRQEGPKVKGELKNYEVTISIHASFLEMLDVLNEDLIKKGERPIEFEHDCREGICGSCSLVVNGTAHGPQSNTAVCQLHMRHFKNGETITIEPWRASAFPIIKDLVVDRSAFDRIMSAGGFIAVNTGAAQDANSILIGKELVDQAFDYAACIGCGACVAACPNASASLFTGAKISQLALLPQGDPERKHRVQSMVNQMEVEGFGDCSNHGECEAVCPKGISISAIAMMRREYVKSYF